MSANRTDALLIARRYATAIFALATEAGKETRVTEEISQLGRAIDENENLRATLANPLISRHQKADVLAAIAKSADPLTARAIQTLATGGRAELLPTLAELLRAKLSAHRGELVATVTSARPLSANVQRQLETSLANATGKAVQIQLHQDPEILGGLVVQMGSLRLDASLAGALNTMRAHLHAPAHQS